MKHTQREAEKRRIDDDLTVIDLFEGQDFQFDCVIAELDGDHPTVVNHESDRAYYVLNGSGKVEVDGQAFDVSMGDLVSVPSGTSHTIEGELKYLVITSPPFDPSNEEMVG